MATRADVQRFATAGRDVVAIAQADLVATWRQLDTDFRSAETARAQLADVSTTVQDLMVSLSDTYGPVSALLAADFYDDLRAAATVGSRYAAQMAEAAVADQVTASSRWALQPLTNGDQAQTLRNLGQVLQRLVMQPGRLTVVQSVAGDPDKPRWARVPQGDTCAFCLLLASRGAVYRTEATAGEMDAYHGDCDCTPTPLWRDDQLPDGYDPGALFEKYDQARAAAGSGDMKAILTQLRLNEGIA